MLYLFCSFYRERTEIIMRDRRKRIIMAVICGIIILAMVLGMLAPMFA